MLKNLRIDNIDDLEDENWRPCRNLACAVLVRALKDASQKDIDPTDTYYTPRTDKCTPADKASAQFFLYDDTESLRFWLGMAGIKFRAFQEFLKGNDLDTDEGRAKLKLGAWDKILRVRKGYKNGRTCE